MARPGRESRGRLQREGLVPLNTDRITFARWSTWGAHHRGSSSETHPIRKRFRSTNPGKLR